MSKVHGWKRKRSHTKQSQQFKEKGAMAMTDAKQVSQRRLSFARLDEALEGQSRIGLRPLCWLVMTMLLLCPVLLREIGRAHV